VSKKNSNDTTGNQTRDLPVHSTVPQPTAPPLAPKENEYQEYFLRVKAASAYG